MSYIVAPVLPSAPAFGPFPDAASAQQFADTQDGEYLTFELLPAVERSALDDIADGAKQLASEVGAATEKLLGQFGRFLDAKYPGPKSTSTPEGPHGSD